MAAIRSGVTPACLARCFLRQTGKSRTGNSSLSDAWNQCFLQRSRLHAGVECRSPATQVLLGRRHNGRFLLVSAVAVRHNSSQIPVETVSLATPVVEASASPLGIESTPVPIPTSPLPADSAHVIIQPATEQVVEAPLTALEVLQGAGAEQSLAELGLGCHTPVGLVQNLLEFMHVDLGLPWWGAIVIGTVIARLALFPVIVKGQREAAKLNNVLPAMTKLTNKMNEAKQSGNKFDFAKAYSDLSLFQKKHDVNPLRGFLIPVVQAPVFISFFVALRKMAYLPVPSMQTGGALWFLDLTAADPFYILPVAVTGTMFFILELGAESGVDNPNLRAMKAVFRVMPLMILPLTINFPTSKSITTYYTMYTAELLSMFYDNQHPDWRMRRHVAVFTYWLTSNCISLSQVALLRHPLVRQKLRIPERIAHPTSAMPPNEGLIESIKKGWKNAQLAHQLEERERRIKDHLDLAAKGPLRQTFTHNPLLQPGPPSAAKSAKGKPVAQPASRKRPWEETIG